LASVTRVCRAALAPKTSKACSVASRTASAMIIATSSSTSVKPSWWLSAVLTRSGRDTRAGSVAGATGVVSGQLFGSWLVSSVVWLTASAAPCVQETSARTRRRSSGRLSYSTAAVAPAGHTLTGATGLTPAFSRLRIAGFVPTALQTVCRRLPPALTAMPRTFTAAAGPGGGSPGPGWTAGAAQKEASPNPAPSLGSSIEQALTATV
jgi:hypothetical protein